MSVAVHQTVLAAACGTGIIDCLTAKTNELGTLFRAVASVAGVGFVIWQGISSRGAMARILIAGLAAGIFVWIVFNVTGLKDRVGNEVSAPPPAGSHRAVIAGPPVSVPVGGSRRVAIRGAVPVGEPGRSAGAGEWP